MPGWTEGVPPEISENIDFLVDVMGVPLSGIPDSNFRWDEVRVCVCLCVCVFVYVSDSMLLYICMCVCVCVYIYIYIYIYIWDVHLVYF